jgi:hypothetical protein
MPRSFIIAVYGILLSITDRNLRASWSPATGALRVHVGGRDVAQRYVLYLQ